MKKRNVNPKVQRAGGAPPQRTTASRTHSVPTDLQSQGPWPTWWETLDPELQAGLRYMHMKDAVPQVARQVRYENRVFAFLDILGWSKLIEDSRKGRIAMRRLAGFQLHMRLDQDHQVESPDPLGKCMTHFSDSVVLSWLPPSGRKAFNRILFELAEWIWNLFLNGFLVRGGLVQGKVFHRPGIVFGPALVDAYYLESKTAIHPRVLVSPSLVREPTPPLARRDRDGLFFVDFMALCRGRDWCDDFLGQVRRFLIAEHARQVDARVRAKYEWMIEYFNSLLRDLMLKTVHPIPMPSV